MSDTQIPSSDDNEARLNRKPFFHFWRCFWLTVLFVSVPYAWYSFYVPSNDIAWAESYSSARQQAADAGKPVILYFTGTWCVPCRKMKRQVWADEEVKRLVNTQYIPVAIDVDDPDNAAVMKRYEIGGPPVTIVTDKQGNALDWRAGGISKSEFLEFLRVAKSSSAKAP